MSLIDGMCDNINVTDHRVEIVFSCLYGESEDFLSLLIFNFMSHTDDNCLLMINLPSHLQNINQAKFKGCRVKFKIGGAPRQAWGGTLLGGHAENFRLAEAEVINFKYFVSMASNGLFFRRFDFDAARAAAQKIAESHRPAGLNIDNLPDDWHWPRFKSAPDMIKRLREHWEIDKLYHHQIEGFFATRNDWNKISEIAEDILPYADECRAPLEEIIPGTVLQSQPEPYFAKICHVYWDRGNSPAFREAGVQDVLKPVGMPDYVVMQKWFRRARSAETLAVSTRLGLELTAACQSANTLAGHFGLRSMLYGYLQYLLNKEERISLFNLGVTTKAPSIQLTSLENQEITKYEKKMSISCVAKRQIIPLDGHLVSKPIDSTGAFLLLENNDKKINMNFTVEADYGTTDILRIDCQSPIHALAAQTSVHDLIGYCYFPVKSIGKNNITLCLEAECNIDVMSQQIPQRVVMHYGEKYVLLQPAEASIINKSAFASYELQASSDEFFIGIPIFSNLISNIRLDIVNFATS